MQDTNYEPQMCCLIKHADIFTSWFVCQFCFLWKTSCKYKKQSTDALGVRCKSVCVCIYASTCVLTLWVLWKSQAVVQVDTAVATHWQPDANEQHTGLPFKMIRLFIPVLFSMTRKNWEKLSMQNVQDKWNTYDSIQCVGISPDIRTKHSSLPFLFHFIPGDI